MIGDSASSPWNCAPRTAEPADEPPDTAMPTAPAASSASAKTATASGRPHARLRRCVYFADISLPLVMRPQRLPSAAASTKRADANTHSTIAEAIFRRAERLELDRRLDDDRAGADLPAD